MGVNVLRMMKPASLFPLVLRVTKRVVLAGVVWFVACGDPTGPPRSGMRRLMVSENAACALDPAGSTFCWGVNGAFFEYGVSNNEHGGSVQPLQAAPPRLKWLADGIGTHLCGITEERDAICWGRGTFGQLGRGTIGDPGNEPAKVNGGIAWEEISVGRITTCGLSVAGDAYCWGFNQFGEVGDSTVPNGQATLEPRLVLGGFKFKQVVAGWLHACGITTAGAAMCWGGNASGQLGIGTTDTVAHRFPEPVIGGHTFLQLALGTRYTCGITTNNTAYCWGANGIGQLGDGSTATRMAPESVHTVMKFREMAAGSGFATSSNVQPPVPLQGGVGHTCALTLTGKAFCWGWNGDGQVGDNSLENRLEPVAVHTTEVFETISLSSASTCGMRGNAVWCWGSNLRGQVGRSTNGASAVNPILLPPPFNRP